MTIANNSIPGMAYPTQQAMIGSNPADSARQTAVNKSQAQAQANQLMSGGKYRKSKSKRAYRKYKGGKSIVVPQYQMLYQPQGGNGTNPNNQIQGNSQISTQMAANSVYDNHATKSGGSRRKKGGNTDWNWGCMSGGRKRTKKHTRRSCKSRKH